MGTLLYYERAIDSTKLIALGTLAAATNTQDKAQDTTQLLNYCVTHSYATIHFHRIDMCIKIHSDASYLSETKSRSCAGGYFYLICLPSDPSKPHPPDSIIPPMNFAINIVRYITKIVIYYATKSELVDYFLIPNRVT